MKWLSDAALERLRVAGAAPDLTGTKYRLLQPLGRGGMGAVFLVEDPSLERRVAMKVLDVPEAGEELAARLLQEARVLARLDHPGIVPVYEVGKLADGRVFYTMKCVQGHRLDRWMRQNPALRERLHVFQRLCETVAFAHAQGVLHRDLKPQNIMVGAFGEILVLDWGVAKILESGATPRISSAASAETLALRAPGVVAATRHGSILGTPGYMAPEQARGDVGNLDARTDVFALGAVLAFLLDPAPEALESSASEASQQVTAPSRSQEAAPRRPPRGVPKALLAVVRKAMEPEPAARYDSAQDLADEVDRFLDGRPLAAHPEGLLLRAGRVLWRHRIAVVLLLAYAVVRALVLISRRP